MDQTQILLGLIAAAAVGIFAAAAILRRGATAGGPIMGGGESPFAAATEGMKRCPACGAGNIVTERTCSECGKRL